MGRCLLLLSVTALLHAQGTEPKPKADDYEGKALAGETAIAAEYMVHSFSAEGQTFLVGNYLVAEVALYPPKGLEVECDPADFRLRVDGKVLRQATPQMVADSMRRGSYDRTRGVDVAGSAGPVIFGNPPPPPYGYPGRTPPPPRAPAPDYGSGLPPKEPVNAQEAVLKTALPAGTHRGPVSGFVYYRFDGKASKIHTVELLYRETTLKLK